MLDYKFDTQLLIEGENLSEDAINDYITRHIPGDCLLAIGDEELIKIHFHTNVPWKDVYKRQAINCLCLNNPAASGWIGPTAMEKR